VTIILGMCDPSGKGALLPYDAGSAGHRLWKMSGMDLKTWLASFERVNLLPGKRWDEREALRCAKKFLARRKGKPVIALGLQVRKALEASGGDLRGVVFLPHPSGRSLAYNSPQARQGLRAILEAYKTA